MAPRTLAKLFSKVTVTSVPAAKLGTSKLDQPPSTIFEAARQDKSAAIQNMINAGEAKVSDRDQQHGATALHWAAHSGRRAVCELLIDLKSDVNARDQLNAATVLQWAVNGVAQRPKGCCAVVEFLLTGKADRMIPDKLGNIPLRILLKNGIPSKIREGPRAFLDTFNMLTEPFGVNFRDPSGCTPLMMAVSGRSKDPTEKLLQLGARVSAVDNHGATALNHAISVDEDNSECIYLLLKDGAKIEEPSGRSLFNLAVTRNPPQPIFRAIRDAVENEGDSELLSLRGDMAEAAFYIMMQELDREKPSRRTMTRRDLRRMLLKLVKEIQPNVPKYLFLNDEIDRDPRLKDLAEEGGYGKIECAFLRSKMNQKIVALKKLKVNQTALQATDVNFNFAREAVMWRHLNHPYILPLFGIEYTSVSNEYFMVSPYMYKGTMQIFLNSADGIRAPCNQWLLEVAEGLKYLHEEEVVHGDLRAANVFISDKNQVKLADFGLTVIAESTTATMGSYGNPHGNPRWLSPELLTNKLRRPDFPCDVFSFGRLCIEAYTGKAPFAEMNYSDHAIWDEVKKSNIKPVKPSTMTNVLYNLALNCWELEPFRRPKAQDLVQQLLVIHRK